ncbi:hypothetical protein QA648_12570 [Rhizobium sp. CB3171]|uniref:hypothetical protein n=1 Tax=Rhizobium sp. CB3171 TaxID=3039157 RepID=UPI0024B07E2B|nr:hypothetical protein [Rhizobium sp. CB3171]WFU00986.1 hypothetical protein QA648_12570 [Rhizobium sp. CB3171]
MNITKLTIFSIALGWFGAAHADDTAVARYKDYLPEQIMQLPEQERKSNVPMVYIGAANDALSKNGQVMIQAALNSLMYDGLADFEGAMRAFQQDLGEQPTGKLTVGQLQKLGYRASRLHLTYVDFFSLEYGGTTTKDFASVKGTVKMLDDRIAYPINHVVIQCFRAESYCSYNQVALALPDENSWAQSYSVLTVADEYYKITRWDTNQIDAVPYQNTACRSNQLSFNFETKEFFEIARNNTSGDCQTALGVTLPRLDKPRVSQIVKGDEIVDAEFKRIGEEAASYYSSAFRDRLGMPKTGPVAVGSKP